MSRDVTSNTFGNHPSDSRVWLHIDGNVDAFFGAFVRNPVRIGKVQVPAFALLHTEGLTVEVKCNLVVNKHWDGGPDNGALNA